MTTTPILRLLWLPLPSAFFPSDSCNLVYSANPSLCINNYSSFPCSASSSSSVSLSSYSCKPCVGLRRSFHRLSNLSLRPTWLSGYTKRDQDIDSGRNEDEIRLQMFGSDEEIVTQIPTQTQSVVEGSGDVLSSEYNPVPDVDYLQVFMPCTACYLSAQL